MNTFKKSILLSLLIGAASLGRAQLYPYNLNILVNSGLNDSAAAIYYDSDGPTYIAGTSQYEIASKVGNAIFVSKLDNLSTKVWVKRGRDGHEATNEFAHAVADDYQGNVYVAGETNYTATSSDMLVVKYDMNGNILWSKVVPGVSGHHNSAIGVGVDDNLNAYIGGTVGDSPQSELCAAKFNSAGVQQWVVKHQVTPGTNECHAVKVIHDGHIYLGGTVLSNTGGLTSWVYGLDTLGKGYYEAGVSDTSYGSNYLKAMDVDSAGHVAVTGVTQSNKPFASVLNEGWFSPFVILPSSVTASDPNVGGYTVLIDPSYNLYVAGSTGVAGGNKQAFLWKVGVTFQAGEINLTSWYADLFGSPSPQTKSTGLIRDQYDRIYVAYDDSKAGQSYSRIGMQLFNGPTGALIQSWISGNANSRDHAVGLAADTAGSVTRLLGTTASSTNPVTQVTYQPFSQLAELQPMSFATKKNATLSVDVVHGLGSTARYGIPSTYVQKATNPSHGLVTVNLDGSFTYKPALNFVGIDTFTAQSAVGAAFFGKKATITIHVGP